MNPSSVIARRPDAAEDPQQATAALAPEDAAYIVPDSFAGEAGLAIARGLTLPQLEAIGAEGDGNLKLAVRITLETLAAQSPNDETTKTKQSYVTYSPAWQL